MLTPIQFIEILAVLVIILYTAIAISFLVTTERTPRSYECVFAYVGCLFIVVIGLTVFSICILVTH